MSDLKFEGHGLTKTPHRTLGSRAWCDCGSYCYPEQPCLCENEVKQAAELDRSKTMMVTRFDPARYHGLGCLCGGCHLPFRKGDAVFERLVDLQDDVETVEPICEWCFHERKRPSLRRIGDGARGARRFARRWVSGT